MTVSYQIDINSFARKTPWMRERTMEKTLLKFHKSVIFGFAGAARKRLTPIQIKELRKAFGPKRRSTLAKILRANSGMNFWEGVAPKLQGGDSVGYFESSGRLDPFIFNALQEGGRFKAAYPTQLRFVPKRAQKFGGKADERKQFPLARKPWLIMQKKRLRGPSPAKLLYSKRGQAETKVSATGWYDTYINGKGKRTYQNFMRSDYRKLIRKLNRR